MFALSISYLMFETPILVAGLIIRIKRPSTTSKRKTVMEVCISKNPEKVFNPLKHIILILTVFVQFSLERTVFTCSEWTYLE